MSQNKNNRTPPEKKEPNEVVELENQFILRLPEEPAKALREAIRSGVASLKDRFTIHLEDDMRYGEVRVDHFLMHAKVVDLPTIVESLKTIDNKSFYKTADICQMMICKEDPEILSTDDESPSKNKKKDPNKVDKKFLWPHGITPPTKNVRRRRFRKTLKKKYVEAPEIEKEVKRLLREDNDAVSVKWEIISEDDDQMKQDTQSGALSTGGEDPTIKTDTSKIKSKSKIRPSNYLGTPKHSGIIDVGRNVDSPDENAPRLDLVEHDIFGGAVSDSEEEDTNINIDIDENSQLSVDDTTINDSCSLQGADNDEKLVTSFSSEMFFPPSSSRMSSDKHHYSSTQESEDLSKKYDLNQEHDDKSSLFKQEKMSTITENYVEEHMSKEMLMSRIEEIHEQLQELQSQRLQKQREVENMENAALQQRFQEMLMSLEEQVRMKEMEYESLQSMLMS